MEYDFVQTINTPQLIDEITTASLNLPDNVFTAGTCVQIIYNSTLTSDQVNTLTNVVTNHVANSAYITIENQTNITKLIGYLNNANPTIANTARAIIVANLAPRMQDGMVSAINAQIAAIVGY